MPGDLSGLGYKSQRRSRQRRHVQRLTNMAGSLRPAGVLMDEGAASGEIQQRQATYHRQRALTLQFESRMHFLASTHKCNSLDERLTP